MIALARLSASILLLTRCSAVLPTGVVPSTLSSPPSEIGWAQYQSDKSVDFGTPNPVKKVLFRVFKGGRQLVDHDTRNVLKTRASKRVLTLSEKLRENRFGEDALKCAFGIVCTIRGVPITTPYYFFPRTFLPSTFFTERNFQDRMDKVTHKRLQGVSLLASTLGQGGVRHPDMFQGTRPSLEDKVAPFAADIMDALKAPDPAARMLGTVAAKQAVAAAETTKKQATKARKKLKDKPFEGVPWPLVKGYAAACFPGCGIRHGVSYFLPLWSWLPAWHMRKVMFGELKHIKRVDDLIHARGDDDEGGVLSLTRRDLQELGLARGFVYSDSCLDPDDEAAQTEALRTQLQHWLRACYPVPMDSAEGADANLDAHPDQLAVSMPPLTRRALLLGCNVVATARESPHAQAHRSAFLSGGTAQPSFHAKPVSHHRSATVAAVAASAAVAAFALKPAATPANAVIAVEVGEAVGAAIVAEEGN